MSTECEHSHPEFVPGCYRCDLSRDEVAHAMSDLDAEGDA